MSERRVPTASWPLATWVAPVVPTLTLWLLVLVSSGTGLATGETGGYLTGLGCALAVGVLGALLLRARSPRVRGAGLGLAAGALVTAPVLLVMIAS
jgi:hypothetical protein